MNLQTPKKSQEEVVAEDVKAKKKAARVRARNKVRNGARGFGHKLGSKNKQCKRCGVLRIDALTKKCEGGKK